MPEPLEPRLNEVAAALAALRPSPPALDRDRLLFNAGRASVSRPWLWRIAAAASTAAAARPGRDPDSAARAAAGRARRLRPGRAGPATAAAKDRGAALPPPAPAESEPPPGPLYSSPSTPYTRLEDRVLRWGLDGLAEPAPPPAAPPETLDSLLKSL